MYMSTIIRERKWTSYLIWEGPVDKMHNLHVAKGPFRLARGLAVLLYTLDMPDLSHAFKCDLNLSDTGGRTFFSLCDAVLV